MSLTLSGTNGVVGAGFTLDASGASVTAGVGTFGSIGAGTSMAAAGLHGTMPTIDGHALTSINAANIVGVCTSGLTKTGGFGKFASYAIIAKVRAADSGYWGAYTTGDWRTRDIDTEISDEDGIVTISSNQFTLQAGNYFIRFACSMYHINKHSTRLQNITDGTTAGIGEPNSSYTYSATLMTTGTCRVSIDSAKVFEVQGYPSTTKATNGFGEDMDNGPCHSVRVEIFKEA